MATSKIKANKIHFMQIGRITPSQVDTFETVTLSMGISNFSAVMLRYRFYENEMFLGLYDVDVFKTHTADSNRIIVKEPSRGVTIEVYYVDDTHLQIKWDEYSSVRRVEIVGVY